MGSITATHTVVDGFMCMGAERVGMAPDASADESEPNYNRLFVYAGPEQPDPSNMTTYASESFDFCPPPAFGTDMTVPGQANVIGSSHYITLGGAPLPYREITSCRPIEMVRDFDPVVVSYDITKGIDDVLIREYGGGRVEIHIDTCTFNPPYDASDFDVFHDFVTDEIDAAPTGVIIKPQGWETIHTYPEFDITLWTETVFYPTR